MKADFSGTFNAHKKTNHSRNTGMTAYWIFKTTKGNYKIFKLTQ
jgi:hypothetical protein